MWAYTPDEQSWLAPSSQWATSVMAAELSRRNAAGGHDAQLHLPLPMPAPYDDFVTDPQVMVAK
jgi:hypothetical protein